MSARSLWQRFRNWVAIRAGLLRGQWVRGRVELRVARFSWWPLPWEQGTWRFALYCPPGLRDDEPAPLVVVLHGCGQRAMGFAHAAGFTRAADRERLRLLCPEQRLGANLHRCWNWFLPPAQQGAGELQVVLKALDEVDQRVSSSAVAAIGLSAGGALAALLGFHHPGRIQAVVVAGSPPLLGRSSLIDPRRVMREGLGLNPGLAAHRLPGCAPLLVLHGAEDDVVSPRCAEQLAEQALHVLGRTHPALTMSRAGSTEEHRDAGRLLLRRMLLPGLGHAWSGARGGHPYVQSDGPPMTRHTLDFLRETGVMSRS